MTGYRGNRQSTNQPLMAESPPLQQTPMDELSPEEQDMLIKIFYHGQFFETLTSEEYFESPMLECLYAYVRDMLIAYSEYGVGGANIFYPAQTIQTAHESAKNAALQLFDYVYFRKYRNHGAEITKNDLSLKIDTYHKFMLEENQKQISKFILKNSGYLYSKFVTDISRKYFELCDKRQVQSNIPEAMEKCQFYPQEELEADVREAVISIQEHCQRLNTFLRELSYADVSGNGFGQTEKNITNYHEAVTYANKQRRDFVMQQLEKQMSEKCELERKRVEQKIRHQPFVNFSSEFDEFVATWKNEISRISKATALKKELEFERFFKEKLAKVVMDAKNACIEHAREMQQQAWLNYNQQMANAMETVHANTECLIPVDAKNILRTEFMEFVGQSKKKFDQLYNAFVPTATVTTSVATNQAEAPVVASSSGTVENGQIGYVSKDLIVQVTGNSKPANGTNRSRPSSGESGVGAKRAKK